jgi:pSer/pThr/pTyr-binding forkhead associated (FHA) protein
VNRSLLVEDTWPASPAIALLRLVLTWGAHEVEVSEKHPSLTVGRDELSGIVIKDDLVSRLHARIEYRNVRFSLTDQSSNGTYVADSTGKTRVVRNKSCVLAGTGTISFGIDPESGQSRLVRYAVSP